jgi:hypothetical protein
MLGTMATPTWEVLIGNNKVEIRVRRPLKLESVNSMRHPIIKELVSMCVAYYR